MEDSFKVDTHQSRRQLVYPIPRGVHLASVRIVADIWNLKYVRCQCKRFCRQPRMLNYVPMLAPLFLAVRMRVTWLTMGRCTYAVMYVCIIPLFKCEVIGVDQKAGNNAKRSSSSMISCSLVASQLEVLGHDCPLYWGSRDHRRRLQVRAARRDRSTHGRASSGYAYCGMRVLMSSFFFCTYVVVQLPRAYAVHWWGDVEIRDCKVDC